jgi:hypothetical protein
MALYNAKKGAVIDGIAQGIVTGYGLAKNKQSANAELETVEGIVDYLGQVGIITDSELWLEKLEEDANAYWLARKCANYINKL